MHRICPPVMGDSNDSSSLVAAQRSLDISSPTPPNRCFLDSTHHPKCTIQKNRERLFEVCRTNITKTSISQKTTIKPTILDSFLHTSFSQTSPSSPSTTPTLYSATLARPSDSPTNTQSLRHTHTYSYSPKPVSFHLISTSTRHISSSIDSFVVYFPPIFVSLIPQVETDACTADEHFRPT